VLIFGALKRQKQGLRRNAMSAIRKSLVKSNQLTHATLNRIIEEENGAIHIEHIRRKFSVGYSCAFQSINQGVKMGLIKHHGFNHYEVLKP
jgi:hypothetical protein